MKADHLRMRAFSYTWSLLVMQQRRRSNHLIHHSRKTHATCKPHGSMFYRTRVIADQSFTFWEEGFWTLFALVNLILTRWPSYTWYKLDRYSLEIHRMYKYELSMSRLLKVIVWQTYRQTGWQKDKTDVTKIIYHAASRVVNNLKFLMIKTTARLF